MQAFVRADDRTAVDYASLALSLYLMSLIPKAVVGLLELSGRWPLGRVSSSSITPIRASIAALRRSFCV
jgi:hypothetical protein